MAQILLYKNGLTVKQRDRLAEAGVIAIKTERPEDFRFLDLQVAPIETCDMVWASLDACGQDESYDARVAKRLVKNLTELAHKKMAKGGAEGV